MGKIIGIDISTNNSRVAVMEAGKPVVVPDSDSGGITRSHGSSADILQKAKKAAEDYLGEVVIEAVVCVPASFSRQQRQALKDAGKTVGLDIKRIISDVAAMSLAYGFSTKNQEQEFTVAICNSGEGFVDFAIASIGYGVFEVKSVADGTYANDAAITGHMGGALCECIKETGRIALSRAGISFDEINKIDEVILAGFFAETPEVGNTIKSFFKKGGYYCVNAAETAAMGVAIQGGILGGHVKDVMLLDVAPSFIGIETGGGEFTRIVTKDTTIPTKKSRVFSTTVDGQTAISIHVLEGESYIAGKNTLLGHFILDGIPAAPSGESQIEVSVGVDANGYLHVSARDFATGKERSVSIDNAGVGKDERDSLDIHLCPAVYL